MSIAAYSITDLLSSTEARSSSAVRTEPYDIHVLGLDSFRLPKRAQTGTCAGVRGCGSPHGRKLRGPETRAYGARRSEAAAASGAESADRDGSSPQSSSRGRTPRVVRWTRRES